ncbi:hypothetical protein SISSUDRAFT_1122579 [Sistotremastrum suecicum HHB10207 ss-3]|uniref:Uncharacterized protein n=1 Tax=Sistotremastrum suecicum HHB10207 ss-3 TaxID=1314776 RepID=A0A165Z5Q6_9AGAM|nr:hypothetical protein SISSUDRAFT_1122579 [Sistotremastrum suecicum HHB10207 ss-3]
MLFINYFFILTIIPTLVLSAIDGVYPVVKYPALHSFDYPVEFSTTSTYEVWADYTVIIGWSKCFPGPHATLGGFITETVDLIALDRVYTSGEPFVVNLSLKDRVFDVRSRTTFYMIATVTSGLGRSELRHVERYWTNVTVDPRHCSDGCQSKPQQDFRFESKC